MKILSMVCYGLVFCLLNSAQFALAQTASLPSFKLHESYKSVRAKMLHAGWAPLHVQDADICMDGDLRCQGRPEMLFCAGAGRASCKFLWQKEDKIIGICTVGEVDAVYANLCAYTP